MKNLPSERGQAIVLIVLAIFGLLGMAALGIDLGQLYATRRNAQNAADAAALAAAYEASAGSKDPATAITIAKQSAIKNGFKEDGSTVWVQVNNPPVNSPYCPACGAIEDGTDYYQVLITVRMKPIFSQFIFSGLKETQVEAVAHSTDADEMTAGNALMALNETADDAMNLDGNTTVHIIGGNMRSNGGMQKKGGSGNINVESPAAVYYAKGFTGKTGPFTDAKPEGQALERLGKFQAPACPATAADASGWSSSGGIKYQTDSTYGTTTYVHASEIKSSINLDPGIHCFYGGMSLTGGDVITGEDVLIVMMAGDVKMKGNSTFSLRAATDMKDSNGNQWGGMVFYAPKSNPASIDIGGTNGGDLYGVVYAPASACDVGGNPNNTANHTSVICDTIKIHGNPDLYISYIPEELFHFPPLVELVQ